MRPSAFLAASAALILSASVVQAAPSVVASIKPVHSLVAAVMDGVGEPSLLVKGAASPHTYAMRPSDATALDEADVVFWVGEGLETFLVDPLATLAADAKVVSLIDVDGLRTYPYREGGVVDEAHEGEEATARGHGHDHEGHDHQDDHDHAAHDHEARNDDQADDHDDGHAHDEAHDHDDAHDHEGEEHASGDAQGEAGAEAGAGGQDHDGHHHHHGDVDAHVWLDPANGSAMLAAIAATLAEVDPENAERYRENAQAMTERLATLDREIDAQLEPVAEVPFVVFHDAYQYFQRHYGLNMVAAITLSPEQAPGAARVSEIQETIRESGAACVFAEPQFEPRIVAVVTEGTEARQASVDPVGADLEDGKDLYPNLLSRMAESFADCLSGGV